MDYIRGVFEKEYSADRYQSKIGQYLAYLYTSYYTENETYNRENPTLSFRKLLPNIISGEVITEYNAFFERSEEGLVDLIVDTTDGGEALRGIVESYVEMMALCSVSIYFNPILGSIVGATWLMVNIMNNAITRINLLSLATTLSSRVGYRLEIYAGLEQRP